MERHRAIPSRHPDPPPWLSRWLSNATSQGGLERPLELAGEARTGRSTIAGLRQSARVAAQHPLQFVLAKPAPQASARVLLRPGDQRLTESLVQASAAVHVISRDVPLRIAHKPRVVGLAPQAKARSSPTVQHGPTVRRQMGERSRPACLTWLRGGLAPAKGLEPTTKRFEGYEAVAVKCS